MGYAGAAKKDTVFCTGRSLRISLIKNKTGDQWDVFAFTVFQSAAQAGLSRLFGIAFSF